MGNYYLHTPDGKEIHLGKAHIARPFSFRGHPDLGVTTYAAWLDLLQQGDVTTEAGTPIAVEQMANIANELPRYPCHRGEPREDQVDDGRHRFTLTEFC